MKHCCRRINLILICAFLFGGTCLAESPYETYKNTLLTKYGISISFPEEVAEHYPQFNNPETQPSIVFNELDTITGFTFYTFDAVVKLSPDVCILISNILNQKSSFKEHEFYVNDCHITLDNTRPHFDSQLFYNCNLPWEWWPDYEGEEKRLRDECRKKHIQRSTTAAWVKESNAELGYITRFPHYEKIGYRRTHEELFEYTLIGAPYNACYGVELIRLYNPASIRMLVFINTDKEKNVMKCIERICNYVAFDHSQVEELKQKD